MSYNITLNSSNVVQGTSNSAYQYNFLSGSFDVPEDAEMCVSQITIPYSWVNVSAALGNNVLAYAIPAGSSVQYFSTTLPDGFYNIASLNTALQSLFKTNGHYWSMTSAASGTINTTYYYPITLSYNTSLYTTTVTSVVIPVNTGNPTGIANVFGTGATAGSWSGGGYPTTILSTYNYASLFIPQTVGSSSLGFILGFVGGSSTISPASSAGTFYPTLGVSTAITVSANGNSLSTPPFIPPIGTSVNGIVVRCNLVDNKVTGNTDILDSFPITTTYGSNINYSAHIENWIKLKKGRYNNLIVYFADQNLNQLKMLDNNVLITLLIRFPK